jgi:amino acid transporter
MENEKNLFDLQLDAIAKNHLKETAKWARFLAIVGLIGLGILVIASVIAAVTINNKTTNYYDDPVSGTAEVAGTIIGMLMIVALYFFPCYFLLRFSAKMNSALASDDAATLNESLRNLKVTFRYMGILTIIFLALFALGMLANLGDV